MNKKEIENKIKEVKEQITELQQTVNNLEEQLNKTEGRWKPNENEQYYYICSDGVVVHGYNGKDTSCKNRISVGNCFKTMEEAKFEAERLKVIAELKEFTFEPADWKDRNQGKYVLAYDHIEKKITYCILMWIQRDNLYFETKEIMKKAIEQVGEDRIMRFLFGVEK